MKIDFTPEEIFRIRLFLHRYHNINVEMEKLKKQAEDIQKKMDGESLKLKEIKKEEDEFMETLHNKYGKFGLEDIDETLKKYT